MSLLSRVLLVVVASSAVLLPATGTSTAKAFPRSCPNVRGAEVIGATNMSCRKGRRQAVWYVNAFWAALQSRGAVYVSVNAGGSELERRPADMHLVSNENLHRIRWSSWGGPAATGRAVSYANAPSPGHRVRNPVRVRLSGRRTCDGVRVYTVVRLHFTRGVPYAGQPRVERFPFGCPPSF